MLKIKIPSLSDLLPPVRHLCEAAATGISTLIIDHLRVKNSSSAPRNGFPKSNYWAKAAESVTTKVADSSATVSVEKEGAALHYHGGTVLPKKKAPAIPVDPIVADIWPSEYSRPLAKVANKKSGKAFLIDHETGKFLYLLLPHATIPADSSVLPADNAILAAAESACFSALKAYQPKEGSNL